ncbi:hypothetical protein COL154_010466 [Colletotrichum chrysophilum]|uniref:AA1-like domain-containing protein n=1 Tax=Colletotrichum noveboracense TaxID=2664923 RepID=A0A9W4RPR1_9PEZI|nr:uncharacterized protein CGCA056_v005697 [Colletotrichum aenigma]XP_053029332.1 uncharacterized protein COL26b_014143 [Colletotrichum chrysophilum]KAH9232991.1 hypothetical protein K456DRAFT_1837863 [Colletotrichum gloeosporioides 23]KAJ0268237.1 hypothetical protein COL940_013581 [Colletotrichum noveboracense]KAJ0271902.1 hypothetical protein CBS470a_012949 [Colletotrichum nupharicola]KAF5523569.1 hypothetical protein CGCA056_v005697 [Colletotrichum aenigma]KAJ0299648.1 hypothetical protei
MQLLSTLLFLAPALASPIAPRDEPTCGQKSGKLSEWTLTDFDFHASYIFTTPAHQNSWGYVSFNVSNPVLDYTVSCSAASSRLNDFFYGEMVYDCKAPDGESATTSFTFSRPDGALALNQSWTCNDDPKYPARYTAKGGAVADLSCEETSWQNLNWTIGEVYSRREIKCDKITLPTPITEISAVA